MKRKVRSGTFETNSSSVHSLVMCSKEEYEKWENKECYFLKWKEEFITIDDIKKEVLKDNEYKGSASDIDEIVQYYKDNIDECLYTEEEYFDNCDTETFYEEHTVGKETVVAFGYYGWDG